MTDLSAYLDAVQARADAATPGPWTNGTCTVWYRWRTPDDVEGVGTLCYQTARASDPEFIAAARSDVPAMVAVLRDIERLCDQALAERPDAEWAVKVRALDLRAALSSLTPDTPRSET